MFFFFNPLRKSDTQDYVQNLTFFDRFYFYLSLGINLIPLIATYVVTVRMRRHCTCPAVRCYFQNGNFQWHRALKCYISLSHIGDRNSRLIRRLGKRVPEVMAVTLAFILLFLVRMIRFVTFTQFLIEATGYFLRFFDFDNMIGFYIYF